jgi:hypothetical protein
VGAGADHADELGLTGGAMKRKLLAVVIVLVVFCGVGCHASGNADNHKGNVKVGGN